MSVATPALLAKEPIFPRLLPRPPQPYPIPHEKPGRYATLNGRRDLQKEMDDLSDEENELEDMNLLVHNRGFNFLIPIGRTVTQQEERNDADEDSEESNSQSGAGPPSPEGDGENDSAPDLDASVEDMDADDDDDTDEDDDMDDDDEFEEEPSDV
ncbi:hypothetical protein ONZ45_g1013 [Pleurotus djamor]|nr:hypothetical protein ONZ45_g1013 [Pleurotus djamor]